MDKLEKACEVAITECLAVGKDEMLLIIGDEPSRKIAYSFFNAGGKWAKEVILVEIVPREIHGQEPPSAVADMMKIVDVVIASKFERHKNCNPTRCYRGYSSSRYACRL